MTQRCRRTSKSSNQQKNINRNEVRWNLCPLFFCQSWKMLDPELSRKAFTHLLRHLINWRGATWLVCVWDNKLVIGKNTFARWTSTQQKWLEVHVGKCSFVSDSFHIIFKQTCTAGIYTWGLQLTYWWMTCCTSWYKSSSIFIRLRFQKCCTWNSTRIRWISCINSGVPLVPSPTPEVIVTRNLGRKWARTNKQPKNPFSFLLFASKKGFQ